MNITFCATISLLKFLITGKSFNYLNAQIESWFSHNWSKDPFARGVKKSFEDTFYIIGEGTALDASRGTVHGAFESGWNIKL